MTHLPRFVMTFHGSKQWFRLSHRRRSWSGRSGVRHSAPTWVPLAATDGRMSRTRKTKVSAAPMCEVTALVYLVEINELVIASLGLASWRTTDLSGEDRHGSSAS